MLRITSEFFKNGKFSGYCFYMNTNILGQFHICISTVSSPLPFLQRNGGGGLSVLNFYGERVSKTGVVDFFRGEEGAEDFLKVVFSC